MFFEFRCLRYKQDRQNVVGHNKEGLVIVFFYVYYFKEVCYAANRNHIQEYEHRANAISHIIF